MRFANRAYVHASDLGDSMRMVRAGRMRGYGA